MKTNRFALFSDCIPVQGAKRSIICDMSNNAYHFIPNGLYDILKEYNGETIDYVKTEFENKYDDVIDEYFDFLLSKKIIFFTSNPEFFPKISLEWDSPCQITNAIIDFKNKKHDFKRIIEQLETLKCSHLQLRFFKHFNLKFISHLLEILNEEQSRILSIDLLLPYSESFKREYIDSLIRKNPRIHAVILYDAPVEKKYEAVIKALEMGYFILTTKKIVNEKSCGIIHEGYFYSNVKLFSESLNHNTCLNRKIAIDKDGNIKNCPSMATSFGNIQHDTLNSALGHKEFKKYWNITKDQIEVCKDCEFRYICTDCRAYKENPNDDYSKPLKCGYDPYTNKWEKWSINPLKQKAIEYYDMQELIKKL